MVVWLTLIFVALPACARNPVTGEREITLVSEDQEIALGRQSAQQVEQAIGLVQDDALQRYVQGIGARLAADSERPNLPWTFRVVDDPTPNAFALPGGFIYVTRGLLSLMQNEAELASVLGHEIGHVTARHSVQQISRAQLAQLGLGLGMIFVPEVAAFGDLASTGLGLLFLKYGRDAERQADDLGFRYALEQNYDVREMADVFASLQRAGDAAGQSPLPSWLATHPDPGSRVQATEARVEALDRPLNNTVVNQAQFLAQIDGLVYGENPRMGFFENGVFLHPDLRFRLDFPQGWQTQNTPQAVMAGSPQQDAVMQLTLAGNAGAEQAANQFFSQQGLRAVQSSREQINGLPGVASTFTAQTQQGQIAGFALWVDYQNRTYQMLAYTPAQRFGSYEAAFRRALGSFAPLTDQRALNVQPNRLDIVSVQQASSLSAVASRSSSVIPLPELALINQLPGESARVGAGESVKVVVRGN